MRGREGHLQERQVCYIWISCKKWDYYCPRKLEREFVRDWLRKFLSTDGMTVMLLARRSQLMPRSSFCVHGREKTPLVPMMPLQDTSM